jgi:hypothetical protein
VPWKTVVKLKFLPPKQSFFKKFKCLEMSSKVLSVFNYKATGGGFYMIGGMLTRGAGG